MSRGANDFAFGYPFCKKCRLRHEYGWDCEMASAESRAVTKVLIEKMFSIPRVKGRPRWAHLTPKEYYAAKVDGRAKLLEARAWAAYAREAALQAWDADGGAVSPEPCDTGATTRPLHLKEVVIIRRPDYV